MATDELKLPWNLEHKEGVQSEFRDNERTLILLAVGMDTRQEMYLCDAVNSHLDLTASVSELKHLLEKRRDDNAELVEENANLRVAAKAMFTATGEIAELVSLIVLHPEDRIELGEKIYEIIKALTGDEKKGADHGGTD